MISLDNFRLLLNNNMYYQEWYHLFNLLLPKYEINTNNRVAAFISQCSYESNYFNSLEENLNYSAESLDRVFPKYFKNAGRNAKEYARNPKKIANIVYANRMGNGGPETGDGWRYRGRGVIQLTGYNNYRLFAASLEISTDKAIQYLETRQGALESACWFWKTNNLNKFADSEDIIGLTKAINGGTHGLSERLKLYEEAKSIILGKTYFNSIIKLHSTDPIVKEIQKALGITADGIFGRQTEEALKDWQYSHGLKSDGIAGPKTLSLLLV